MNKGLKKSLKKLQNINTKDQNVENVKYENFEKDRIVAIRSGCVGLTVLTFLSLFRKIVMKI